MWIHRKVAREARGGWPLRLFFRRSGGLGWFLSLSVSAVAPASAQVDPEGTTGRAIVAAFDIHGAESVNERELRAVLQTRASPWFPWRDRVYFDPAALESDLRRTREFYAARGFPSAAVTSEVAAIGGDAVRVRLIVEEGEPLRLDSFVFEGFEGIVPAEALASLAGGGPLQPGEPLARAGLTATAQRALDLVRDAGYPRANVSIAESHVASGGVQVRLRVDPGPAGLFGRIDITGNQRLDDSLIRRYVEFSPGQRFALQPVRVTHRRLAGLGLFESVDVEVADPAALTADVPILIRVAERDLREYQVSFGYGTEEQLSAEAEWRHLNFLGGARRLAVLGRWSWMDRVLQGTLVDPYLFHPDLSLGVVGHVSSLDQRFFDVLSAGGAASVSYRHGASTVVGVTYTHQYQRTRLSEPARADPELRSGIDAIGVQDGPLSAVQLELVRDTRDAPADPRRGYRASLRLERAGGWLPGAFAFYAAVADARHFLALGPVTIAHRAQYGSVVPSSGAANVPIFRRYFLGGSESLRGWGRLEVSPLSPAGQPVGGRAFLAATGEVRLPVAAGVAAAVFVDAGNVWREAWTVRLPDLRYSAGAGVRYDSPFGPLRLDLGYQFTPIDGLRMEGEPRDRRWRVHVAFGHSF